MLTVAGVSSLSASVPSAPFGSSVAHSSATVACVTVARVVGRDVDVDAASVAPVTAVASSAVVAAALVVVQPAAALFPE